MKKFFGKNIGFLFSVILILVAFGFVRPICAEVASQVASVSGNADKAAESLTAKNEAIKVASAAVENKATEIKLTDAEIARYVSDSASIVDSQYRNLIAADCIEIEKQARIRVLVKTEVVKNLEDGQAKADGFFSEWIRSISLDKRGILIYAMLPEGASRGKILLKVGIGLKYLITKEMGESILNQAILPSNAENSDGKGFQEGVRSIKRMLLDELARDRQHIVNEPKTFDLFRFLWSYKEVLLGLVVLLFFMYIVFFIERCPKCGGSLKITKEILKEPGENSLGLQRKIYVCEKCGLSRRKKEPVYPKGREGLMMRLSGTRRNVRID